jgi:translation initiation factor eIF-2B subunit epsilon
VLGNHIKVGNHCHIMNSHIWDNVVVQDNVRIESSVIAKDCIIMTGAMIPRGCVIGQGCVIGAHMKLKPFTRITLIPSDNFDDDPFGNDDEYENGFDDFETSSYHHHKTSNDHGIDINDPTIVGTDGKGHEWHPPGEDMDDDSDNEDDIEKATVAKDVLIQLQSIGSDPSEYYLWRHRIQENAALDIEQGIDVFSDDENDEEFGMDGITESEAFSAYTDGAFTFGHDDTPVVSPLDTNVAASGVIGRQRGINVVKEMIEICLEFDDSVFPMENLSIELNSYKFSQNATYSDCTMAATLAMLQKMDITPSMKDGKLIATLKSKLEGFWAALLQKMSIGLDEEIAVIHALEMAATASTDSMEKHILAPIAEKLQSGLAFRFVLQTMHDVDVLSEEAILNWAFDRRDETEKDDSSARALLFRSQPIQEFLKWLEEDDAGSDEDSSD